MEGLNPQNPPGYATACSDYYIRKCYLTKYVIRCC